MLLNKYISDIKKKDSKNKEKTNMLREAYAALGDYYHTKGNISEAISNYKIAEKEFDSGYAAYKLGMLYHFEKIDQL